MRTLLLLLLLSLCCASMATAQATYPPIIVGMRVIVGGSGALVRNTPSGSGQCGTPPHVCTAADSAPPNTYGVIQSDPFVLDPGGWYWERVAFDNGMNGWVSAYPPYLNMLSPPQMVQGIAVTLVGDYNGPVLTQAVCILDGVNSAATLQLTATTGGQMGTLLCPWGTPGVGNHKGVIKAVNNAGTADSSEFQFAVTVAAVPTPPSPPQNLRITSMGGTQTQTVETAKPATTAKPK